MARAVQLCECQGQAQLMADDDLTPLEPRKCLHCGRRTPPNKWRCDDCQLEHDARRDRVLDVVRANRASHSRVAHRDAV